MADAVIVDSHAGPTAGLGLVDLDRPGRPDGSRWLTTGTSPRPLRVLTDPAASAYEVMSADALRPDEDEFP
jgi:hypothetical protein